MSERDEFRRSRRSMVPSASACPRLDEKSSVMCSPYPRATLPCNFRKSSDDKAATLILSGEARDATAQLRWFGLPTAGAMALTPIPLDVGTFRIDGYWRRPTPDFPTFASHR